MIGTPFGMANQFYEFFRDAEGKPDWFRQLLTYRDTDSLSPDEIEALKRDMLEEEFAQEFECDWNAAVKGAYYGKLMAAAEREGRITRVPHDPALPVHTSWDLGMADLTVVWCWQVLGAEIRAINCLAFQGTGLPEVVRALGALPYQYGKHWVPHDAKVRELGTGRSRLEMAQALGMRWDVAPEVGVANGIEATRAILPRVWFDREKCREGVEALKTYRTEWDDLRRVFKLAPLHSWESHYADAVRYFAVSTQGKDPQYTPLDYSKLDRMYG
jgi:hypothetical protein